eukprot:2793052-Rhodomonas_salina.2
MLLVQRHRPALAVAILGLKAARFPLETRRRMAGNRAEPMDKCLTSGCAGCYLEAVQVGQSSRLDLLEVHDHPGRRRQGQEMADQVSRGETEARSQKQRVCCRASDAASSSNHLRKERSWEGCRDASEREPGKRGGRERGILVVGALRDRLLGLRLAPPYAT